MMVGTNLQSCHSSYTGLQPFEWLQDHVQIMSNDYVQIMSNVHVQYLTYSPTSAPQVIPHFIFLEEEIGAAEILLL